MSERMQFSEHAYILSYKPNRSICNFGGASCANHSGYLYVCCWEKL